MKLTLSHNDKSWLSFDLKDLFWLALVIGVWATLDYRTKYTNNVLKWNEELQQKIGTQNGQIVQLKDETELGQPDLGNSIQLEKDSMENIKSCARNYLSMPTNQKAWFLNQLQLILDAVTKNRDFITGELERLKAENK